MNTVLVVHAQGWYGDWGVEADDYSHELLKPKK